LPSEILDESLVSARDAEIKEDLQVSDKRSSKIIREAIDKKNFSHKVVPYVMGVQHVPRQQVNTNPSNAIKSTRYNVITFLPITMMQQFARIINCFYLFNALLQCIPTISTNSPLATIIPLTFMIMLGVLKELVVELKRWHDDREANRKPYRRLVPKGVIIAEKKQVE